MIDDGQFDASRREKAAGINTAVPNAARVADFLNGGRDSFETDRRAASSMLRAAPAMAAIVPGVLAFHQRSVRFLALEAGIRQFIDVGTGLPGVETSRDLAQSVDPACRVVYVDNDPMVLTHVRAFSQSTSQGAVVALDGKLTDPVALLDGAAATLDFGQPVAVLLPSTLPFIPDTARAAAIVSTLMAAMSAGSQLAICHVASDLDPALAASADHWNRMSPLTVTLRSRAEVAGLTAGLEPVDPGLVPVDEWRPTPGEARPERAAPVWAVVARKPALSGDPHDEVACRVVYAAEDRFTSVCMHARRADHVKRF
jgi:S-adenosyl methyltransferase